MLLSEALQERKDLKVSIEMLKRRLQSNAIVQEGEKPAEEPAELFSELDEKLEKLKNLVTRINITNSTTYVDDKTLTEMIAERDSLQLKIQAYQYFVTNASAVGMRSRGSEIKILPTMEVKDIQKEIDKMSKELRLLDNKIQQTNWSVELS